MESIHTAFLIVLAVLVSSVLYWLFPLKLLYRIRRRMGRTAPCPYRFAWVMDLGLRRWLYRSVLDRLGLRPGMIALEVGCGTGTFSLPAARRVGPIGRVIAVDLQAGMIAKIEKRARNEGITNIETHVASAFEIPLEDASVDCVFLIAVLGEIVDPVRALVEAYRVLKHDGVLSITEEFSDPDYYWPSEIARLVERCGFEAIERFGGLWLHTLNSRKN